MAALPKVPVYSLSELKNTTDDAITPYLTSLPKPYNFVADNTKSNVRLLVGYSAVAIAAVSFYFDYKKGADAVRPWIFAAVLAYFALNTVLTVWIWLVEGGQVFEGTRGQGEKLRLCSSSKKHSPMYTLQVLHTSASGQVLHNKTIESPFTRWFASDGAFRADPFRAWLASEIEGLQDEKESASGSAPASTTRKTRSQQK